MAEYKKDIELRSEKVRNIVGQMPPALLRRGITIISLALVLLFVSAYFIPYPETVRIDLKLQCIPDSDRIKGIGYCSPLVKSKLKEGQVVHLELVGYPSSVYGLVEGRISNVHPIPETNASQEPLFKIEILFSSELKTSSGKIIPYFSLMEGTGTILLSNKSILERFWRQ
jgi:hypothetical protein